MSPSGRRRALALVVVLLVVAVVGLRASRDAPSVDARLRADLGLSAAQARCAEERMRRVVPASTLSAYAADGFAAVPTGERDIVMIITTACATGDPDEVP